MVQVGVITVGGRQIGIVTQSDGDVADHSMPMFSGADDVSTPMPSGHAMGADRAYGGHHHYSDHSDSGHAPNRAHHDRDNSGDVGNVPTSSSGNPFDRARFAKELEQKPWLKEKMAHISLGENQDPHANLAVIETMMNRAVVRGTSLESQVKRHRSSGVDEGGYYAGYAASFPDSKREMFNRNLGAALGHGGSGQSNISNYATDNSSGDLAARERATGSFVHHMTLNGENFFSPGRAEPAFRDRWQQLNQRAQEFEKNKTSETAAAKPFDPETMAP